MELPKEQIEKTIDYLKKKKGLYCVKYDETIDKFVYHGFLWTKWKIVKEDLIEKVICNISEINKKNKIDIENLIKDSVEKLEIKLKNHNVFNTLWLNSCISAISGLIEDLSLKKSEYNDFKKYLNNLNKEKVCKLYKILIEHVLVVYLKNSRNNLFLKQNSINKEDFKKSIFLFLDLKDIEIFDYNSADENFSNNPTNYFIKLYKKIFLECYSVHLDEVIQESIYFADNLVELQKIFIIDLYSELEINLTLETNKKISNKKLTKSKIKSIEKEINKNKTDINKSIERHNKKLKEQK